MLKPSLIQPVPEATARVAKAAFRKGNPLLKLRDELGAIFADLSPRLGQPGLPPWRLALVTLLQFRENLPDRQAAEAVRARIDWKYPWASSWPTRASTTRCCASSARACLRVAPRSGCSAGYSTPAAGAGCSRPGANSGPIRPGCWPPSAP